MSWRDDAAPVTYRVTFEGEEPVQLNQAEFMGALVERGFDAEYARAMGLQLIRTSLVNMPGVGEACWVDLDPETEMD